MAGFLDRKRAAALMRSGGMDAIVLTQPESILYATGAGAGVAAHSRRAGAALLLVPADESVPVTAIVADIQARDFREASGLEDIRTHLAWTDKAVLPPDHDHNQPAASALRPVGRAAGTGDDFSRPEQFDLGSALKLLADAVDEKKLSRSKIGLEFAFVPVADMEGFKHALPAVRWVDASELVCRLRSVKAPGEIEILRNAADYTQAGLEHLQGKVREGLTAADMKRFWRQGAADEAAKRPGFGLDSTWAYISVGPVDFGEGGPLKPGDVIRLDMGCVVRGYSSDIGRTWVLGTPSAAQRSVFDALNEAYESSLGLLKPGTVMRDIHANATRAMRRHGFVDYTRGHFGHGLGASLFSEEWPFISATSDVVIEENMVLAFETPFYIDGLGSFIIEDQVLITADGHESMYTLDRGLVRL